MANHLYIKAIQEVINFYYASWHGNLNLSINY
ncbi:MAG: hypothetical protein JWP12_3544 [Bacteroidetes bacterium]|nr:hypothetical protein [Bacteroidota bacterium]